MQVDSSMPQVDVFEALFSRTDLSKGVQTHISRVYQTLLVMVATAAVGALVQVKYQIGGFLTFAGTFGALIWLAFNPFAPNDVAAESKRIRIACLIAFFVGASLGPGLHMVYDAHGDGIIATAFIASAAMFASFSGSALFSNRRAMIFATAIMGAASSALLVVGISSIFYRTPAMESAMAFLGIVIFSCYTVYDSQIMILQAERGYKDVANHALQLFLDFVNLFVRILKLLSKKKNKRREE